MLLRILGLLLLALLLGLAARASWTAWTIPGGAEIGVHGVVALLLGVAFTLLLAGGLVALMLFSRRRGYDQAAAEGLPRREDGREPRL